MIIGIIGAMEEEIAYIKSNMEIIEIKKKAQMEFFVGNYINKKIIAATSGIGKVNAAMCTQILIDDFGINTIVNIGVAGGIDKKVNLLDVVIAVDLIEHDMDGRACNYKLGQVPRLGTFSFECDKNLVEKALEANSQVQGFKVHRGRIITGDQIISCTEKINFFKEEFSAHAVEMESAAIGHVCYLNNIPFIIIRAISDKADENLNTIYEENERFAIENSIKVLTNLLENM